MSFFKAHTIDQWIVSRVVISKIFHNQVGAAGQSFGATEHWIFAAVITLVTPVFLDEGQGIFRDNPWPIFAFFAVFMVIQFLFVIWMMPETKGRSLEEIQQQYQI